MADARPAVRALAAAATEMIRSDAELLLTPPVVRRWATAAGLPAGWEPGIVLQQLVNLGLPPGTGAEVTEALKGYPVGSTAGLEAAVAARAGSAWEIRVHPDSLREITADALRRPDRFRHLRESFFADTGVRIPLVTLGEDASLPPGGLSFCVFGLTGPLVLDLDAAAEVAADRVTSASARPGALIASALGKLAADRIGALVTTATTARELDRLRASYPKLRGLTSAIGLETVTRLLRALAVEYVNVRNFPLVLQAALDVHERSGSVTDVELLHQVRIRLSHTITRAAAKGADHLEVSRVPKQLEDLSSSDAVARLMAFADQVVASGARHGRVLVTSPQARAAVRIAVATAHPTLAVLGEDELAGAPQVAVTPD